MNQVVKNIYLAILRDNFSLETKLPPDKVPKEYIIVIHKFNTRRIVGMLMPDIYG